MQGLNFARQWRRCIPVHQQQPQLQLIIYECPRLLLAQIDAAGQGYYACPLEIYFGLETDDVEWLEGSEEDTAVAGRAMESAGPTRALRCQNASAGL